MAGRPLMLATLLGASIGVPYFVSNSTQAPSAGNVPPAAQKSAWPTFGTTAGNTTSPPPLLPPSTSSPSPPYPSTATPTAMPGLENMPSSEAVRFHSLRDVLRFDISKEWVYQNWDRKSTGLGDPELFGIRVTLITGTRRTDLAGALTYLFDGKGQVQHISFRGRTADTTPLVQLLTQTYQFQRMEAPAGEQLYQVRSGTSVYSELRTRPESVLLEASPQASFGVVLELGRPGSNRALQPPVPHLDIPEVATKTPPPAANAAGDAKSETAAEPALVGKLRPATQAEHNQVFNRRWPN